MLLIITDLDGTLLDSTYSFEPAREALNLLSELRIPLILCTSKTRAEVEVCRSMLGNRHPFIVENGGALYMPDLYFGRKISAPVRRDGYAVIEFGTPYNNLVQCLVQAADESSCVVRGFHQMSVEEISRRCNMSVPSACLAKRREYDEPFEVLKGDGESLTAAIEKRKKRWTRGGSFYHILGANDKAHCVSLLIHFYTRIHKQVVTVGLGDGLNDAGFLNMVDIPMLLESPSMDALQKTVPRGISCRGSGPQAWNKAVIEAVKQHLPTEGSSIGLNAGKEESINSTVSLS